MSTGISISIDAEGRIMFGEGKSKVKREKGISLIDTPKNFTVIDIETTGFDPRYDAIIEIGAIKVRDNKIIDKFESLVNTGDCYLDSFITELTGISNEMLKTAPTLEDILPSYIDFIEDDIVLGHNVHFDINFLYDVMLDSIGYKFSNDLVDLLRLSRKVYPNFKNHKLETVATNLGVDISNKHRSLRDCETTYESFIKLTEHLKNNEIDLIKLFDRKHYRGKDGKYLDLRAIESDNDNFEEDHLLYEKNCTFTGKLERMERKDAAQLVVNLGGKCLNGVTKNSNFLILGNFDYCSSIKDGKSSKLKKAEELILNGQDLKILSEDVFYDLISEKSF